MERFQALRRYFTRQRTGVGACERLRIGLGRALFRRTSGLLGLGEFRGLDGGLARRGGKLALGLQPVLEFVAGSAAATEKDFVGACLDLVVGRLACSGRPGLVRGGGIDANRFCHRGHLLGDYA